MDEQQIERAFSSKRAFFDSGATQSYAFRIAQLRALKNALKRYEPQVLEALRLDLHKPEFEAFSSEVGFMYVELNLAIKRLRRWMRPRGVRTPMVLQPSRSRIIMQALGVVLIVGPWNYPFQLVLAPLVGAIAAGNCAIVKPSANSMHTAKLLEQIIDETFAPNYISCVRGAGATVGPMLIERFNFDHIFFTGSQTVGRQILAMAAPKLCPVTLELGGKSPAIVHSDARLEVAAQRLVWAKLFNAGQTCVAPDYLLVQQSVMAPLVKLLKQTIERFLGPDPAQSPDYARIVNRRQFERLTGYLQCGRVLHGGRHNAEQRYLEPTLLDQVTCNDPVMRDEIFGPILPIIGYNTIDEIVPIVRRNRYPLALYLFTGSKKIERYVLDNVEFGGGAINNALTHLANPKLPFGGVGSSGMGNYHGYRTFQMMSHQKSILKTSSKINIKILFPPYNRLKMKFARLFMK